MSPYHPPDGPLQVLHLDDDLLAVNKPPGLLSVPGKGPDLAECLLSRVVAHWPDALLVHRLDRDTSGVMIFARNRAAQRHLGLQFERRQLEKTYVARVEGRLPGAEGVVDLPLIADWPNRPMQMVDLTHGKPAKTRWRRETEHPDGTTDVRLFPETGRSHQLRIHMRELGCPIVGDPLYGRSVEGARSRMMLHAESLNLRHPRGGLWINLRASVKF